MKKPQAYFFSGNEHGGGTQQALLRVEELFSKSRGEADHVRHYSHTRDGDVFKPTHDTVDSPQQQQSSRSRGSCRAARRQVLDVRQLCGPSVPSAVREGSGRVSVLGETCHVPGLAA